MSSGGIDMDSEWFASKVCSHGAHSGVLPRGRGESRTGTWPIKSMVQIKSMVNQNRKYGRVCDSAKRCFAIG